MTADLSLVPLIERAAFRIVCLLSRPGLPDQVVGWFYISAPSM